MTFTRQLAAAVSAPVETDVAMAAHTTLKVGGPVRWSVTVADAGELAAVARLCADRDVAWLPVGRGSNLLVADAGVDAVAVRLAGTFRALDVDAATGRVRAGGAVKLPTVADRTARAGLAGLGWATAVPGSVGGALRMNAGAHGGESAELLVDVELLRRASGHVEVWPAERLQASYRATALPDDAVVTAATWQLPAGDPEELQAHIAELRAWRRAHQPIGEPSCGSVFTNPPGDSAGRLIDLCGGKGLSVGGARVSDVHANFITTRPGATASDVVAVVETVRGLVAERAGVTLHCEVVRVGV